MAMGFMLVRKDLDIKDNGKIMCPMVLGRLVIQMVPDMLVNFWIIKSMEREHFIKKEMCIEGILRMIILMESSDTKVRMDKFMREIGKIVRNMDMEFINGLMEVAMKDNMLKERNMVEVLWLIPMDKYMMVSGMKDKSMEMGTYVLRSKTLQVSGKMVI